MNTLIYFHSEVGLGLMGMTCQITHTRLFTVWRNWKHVSCCWDQAPYLWWDQVALCTEGELTSCYRHTPYHAVFGCEKWSLQQVPCVLSAVSNCVFFGCKLRLCFSLMCFRRVWIISHIQTGVILYDLYDGFVSHFSNNDSKRFFFLQQFSFF